MRNHNTMQTKSIAIRLRPAEVTELQDEATARGYRELAPYIKLLLRNRHKRVSASKTIDEFMERFQAQLGAHRDALQEARSELAALRGDLGTALFLVIQSTHTGTEAELRAFCRSVLQTLESLDLSVRHPKER